MDVDCDIDQDLLCKFSSMGTTDRDVLIKQLQNLLEFQLSTEAAAFFLDMTNWNLQDAVCAYYDFNNPLDRLPSMILVRDVTIGEGEAVPPNTHFTKTWRIQNNGHDNWPSGVFLKFTTGHQLGAVDTISVDPLLRGGFTDVSVNMVSPGETGIFQGQWRMCSPTGQYFGEVIWVIICVEENGLMGLTQQLNSFGELGAPQRTVSQEGLNPFSSPSKTHLNGNSELFNSGTTIGSPVLTVPHNSPIKDQNGVPRPSLFGTQNRDSGNSMSLMDDSQTVQSNRHNENNYGNSNDTEML